MNTQEILASLALAYAGIELTKSESGKPVMNTVRFEDIAKQVEKVELSFVSCVYIEADTEVAEHTLAEWFHKHYFRKNELPADWYLKKEYYCITLSNGNMLFTPVNGWDEHNTMEKF